MNNQRWIGAGAETADHLGNPICVFIADIVATTTWNHFEYESCSDPAIYHKVIARPFRPAIGPGTRLTQKGVSKPETPFGSKVYT